MPFFPPVRNTRTRLKGGSSARRMGNARKPARRGSHSGAPNHSDWKRELEEALEGVSDSVINTSHLPAGDSEDPQPDELDVISDSSFSISRLARPRPLGSPRLSSKSDSGFINPFDDTANVLDTVSDSDIPGPPPPPPRPPPGTPGPIESKKGHDNGSINIFDDTAMWKTFAQYRSMQRLIGELAEEVETQQQTILSLKDDHAAKMKKVKEGHVTELQKTKDDCDVVIKGLREKELSTLELEVENLGNENAELRNEIAEMKRRLRDTKEWGVEKIECMGYALEDIMLELDKRMGDDKE